MNHKLLLLQLFLLLSNETGKIGDNNKEEDPEHKHPTDHILVIQNSSSDDDDEITTQFGINQIFNVSGSLWLFFYFYFCTNNRKQ